MCGEVRQIPHHRVGQVELTSLDENHCCQVSDRFGDRCEQKHSVAADRFGTGFGALSAEELRFDDASLAANENGSSGHGSLAAFWCRPIVKKLRGFGEPVTVKSDLRRYRILQCHDQLLAGWELACLFYDSSRPGTGAGAGANFLRRFRHTLLLGRWHTYHRRVHDKQLCL